MILDYSIERDVDRVEYIRKLLDEMDVAPTETELEKMGNYILYGKDEEGRNSEQRKEVTIDKKKKTWHRKVDREESLDALMDDPNLPGIESQFMDANKRNIRVLKKTTISRETDGDIPGMRDLWDSIDKMAHTLAVAEGKVAPTETDEIITDPYKIYQLRHWLIDLRKHQYYLKDFYKPTLRFQNIRQPATPRTDFTDDCGYWISKEEWERRIKESLLPISTDKADYEWNEDGTKCHWIVRHQKFDFTNPAHVAQLINFYSDLYMELWDLPDTWGRALLFDFDRYIDRLQLSEAREYILTRRIDKASVDTIAAEIRIKFGLHYSSSRVSKILMSEIPQKVAFIAAKDKALAETPFDTFSRKQCFCCKQWLPRSNIFFARHITRSDGLASNCKDCEKRKRIEQGGQSEYDRRYKSKDKGLSKM